ncbi:sigma-70 family RNA polymerase sigma factor [uncultured Sanguibacteroides sp.]|uniref:sigma-70 family RNA polymerase sigma factor n=1 Tax=uncultured Sanguibacteroides sp. TaxID=1635151 RepID=UPI0025E7A5B0|nr:sigma-70 family RNA polymerase sigma factor [uncultured Sanguibacteroides sp.]
MQDSDNDICLLLKNRDVKGMELLFKEYYRPLVLWADTFLNNMSQAEDLIQDFFIKLWERKVESKLYPRTLKSYLFTAVKNLSLNVLEKIDPLKGVYDVSKIDVPSLEYNDLNEKMLCKIEQEIENLPPRSRNVVKCIYLKGMRYKETAEELNISVATVKTLLVNSLKRLRENTSEIDLEVLLLFIQKSLDRYDRF